MVVQSWGTPWTTPAWQTCIADGHDFGTLSVNAPPGQAPNFTAGA
ncbi:hypothetical protein AB0I49_37870 [Streptomyces sp. NPDC050617]